MLSRVLWCKLLAIWFLVHLSINIFIFDFCCLLVKLHFPRKRQENAWCILVIVTVSSNISRDMLNYHCLRVFRRMENTRPVFPLPEPEYMAVPMLSCAVFRSRAPSRRFFSLQLVQAMPDRLSTRSEDSVLQSESSSVNFIDYFVNFRRVDILRASKQRHLLVPC